MHSEKDGIVCDMHVLKVNLPHRIIQKLFHSCACACCDVSPAPAQCVCCVESQRARMLLCVYSTNYSLWRNGTFARFLSRNSFRRARSKHSTLVVENIELNVRNASFLELHKVAAAFCKWLLNAFRFIGFNLSKIILQRSLFNSFSCVVSWICCMCWWCFKLLI